MTKMRCGCKKQDINITKDLIKTALLNSRDMNNINPICIGIVFHDKTGTPVGKLDKNYYKTFIDTLNISFSGNDITQILPKYLKNYDTDHEKLANFKGDTHIRFRKHKVIKYLNIKNNIRSYNDIIDITNNSIINSDEKDNSLNIYLFDGKASVALGVGSIPQLSLNFEGVLVDYRTMDGRDNGYATYNLNKTAVHEIGHWLGLFHVFDDYEMIFDTPQQDNSVYGNPYSENFYDVSHKDINYLTNSSDKLVAFMNYMDYTDDIAMYMFTPGQINMMHYVINEYRPKLRIKPLLTNNEILKEAIDKSVIDTLTSITESNTSIKEAIKETGDDIKSDTLTSIKELDTSIKEAIKETGDDIKSDTSTSITNMNTTMVNTNSSLRRFIASMNCSIGNYLKDINYHIVDNMKYTKKILSRISK